MQTIRIGSPFLYHMKLAKNIITRSVLIFAVLLHLHAVAQIPDGSTAPDFTLTDYYGTTHNLYSYLDDGKTVFVEIFAAHCPTCWSYHQANTLKDLYNAYGPQGTDELTVLALEYDEYNGHNAFIGIGDPWTTQGNWLEGTPYPIFDVEYPDRGVFTDYNVTFYPAVYRICPDKVVERVLTSESVAQLYEKVQYCQSTLSVDEATQVANMFIDPMTRSLVMEQPGQINSISITDMRGKLVHTIHSIPSNTVSLDRLTTGIYLFEVHAHNGIHVRKLHVP